MTELIEPVDGVESYSDGEAPSEPKIFAHKDIVQLQRLAKKHRTFLVQRVTKRIKLLKNKKGNEAQLSKNQRKVDRLLQRINDMKSLDFDDVVASMIEKQFKNPSDDLEDTKSWFMSELIQDKSSFMSYVNAFYNGGKPILSTKSSKRKREDPPLSSRTFNKEKVGGGNLFTNKLSSYSEKDDKVLNDILKVKRNRPGQRARQEQWKELYGTKARHIIKERTGKTSSDKQPERSHRKKPNRDEIAPQEIMKKLKEEEKLKKEKQREEHPSWLAKRQQASLSSRIDAFAGKKTTFSDDDD